jgi:hypothetical protein
MPGIKIAFSVRKMVNILSCIEKGAAKLTMLKVRIDERDKVFYSM